MPMPMRRTQKRPGPSIELEKAAEQEVFGGDKGVDYFDNLAIFVGYPIELAEVVSGI